MAPGGAGLIISSQTGYMHRLPDEVESQILNTSTEELLSIPYIQKVAMQNSGLAVALSKQFFGIASALPGAIFSVWHNLSGALFASLVRKYGRLTEPSEKI